jgi:hypothetical protein
MNRLRSKVFGIGLAASVSVALILSAVARGDDRSQAEVILAEVKRDSAHASLTADAVSKAQVALERATRMRDANDEARARLAEGLGLRWAEVARDLARAADVERATNEARRAADDAGARAERERARLEDAIARQGRLHAEIEALHSKQNPERTATVGASVDGGAPSKPSRETSPGKSIEGSRKDAGTTPKVIGGDGGALP